MPTFANTLKIMPMGDSITQGTVPGGYRAPLYSLLTEDDYNFLYVGDQDTNPGGGLPADQDNHEGSAGTTSVELQAEIDSTGIIQSSQPNVVLLLIGTNDVGLGASIATADSDIAALVDDIISKDPTVHIFLSNVLQRADGSTWVTPLDATFPSISSPRISHVTLVDMASALTVADISGDGVHPTQTGYNIMATVWDAAINAYFAQPATGLSVQDTTTSQPGPSTAQLYSGPVAGLTSEYITTSADSLNITASTPNWFIQGGSGTNAITVNSGINVLDGGSGSSFLTGGTGVDTFYVDDRNPTTTIWSSVLNFHSGDNATIWGVTAAGFTITWLANQGAAGATGLTAVFTSKTAAQPLAALTLAGYSLTNLTDGTLSVSYGTTASLANLPGSSYMTIHAN